MAEKLALFLYFLGVKLSYGNLTNKSTLFWYRCGDILASAKVVLLRSDLCSKSSSYLG